jgi:hypothetical protein
MTGEFGDQPPFLVGEFGARGASPRRLLALAHGRKFQREDAAKRVLGSRMAGQERIGALDQHAAELDCLHWQAQHAVASLHHFCPHVVEEIREKWKRSGVLGRFFCLPSGNRFT